MTDKGTKTFHAVVCIKAESMTEAMQTVVRIEGLTHAKVEAIHEIESPMPFTPEMPDELKGLLVVLRRKLGEGEEPWKPEA